MTSTLTDLQPFAPEAVVTLGGKRFTVEEVGKPQAVQTHVLKGARGGYYFLINYLEKRAEGSMLFYVTSMRGAGAPLRDKRGQKLHAYVVGDLLTDATGLK